MVDFFGRWFEEKDYSNYPKEKMCDYDHMAIWIRKSGYVIKTSMENLINMILLHFDPLEDENLEYGEEFTVDGCRRYVEDSGGLQEFDYWA